MSKNKNLGDTFVARMNQSTVRMINFRKEATRLGLIAPYGILPPRTNRSYKGQEFIFDLGAAQIAMQNATPDRVYRLVALARKYSDTHFMHEHFDMLNRLHAHKEHLKKNLRVHWLVGGGKDYLTLREWLEQTGKSTARLLTRLQKVVLEAKPSLL